MSLEYCFFFFIFSSFSGRANVRYPRRHVLSRFIAALPAPRKDESLRYYTVYRGRCDALPPRPLWKRFRFEEKKAKGGKKKDTKRRADRLSRASRTVDLRVAGSDKSATAETAATSRKIDRQREGERERQRG